MPLATDKTPEEIRLIDWDNFKVKMLTHPTYQRVSALSEALVVSRIESYFVAQAENWTLAAQLWQLMIDGVEAQYKPQPSEIAQWNQIALASKMPFSFDASGYLKPEEIFNG